MRQAERDSKKRIAFVQLFVEAAASAVPDEIHVVPTGKWHHPVYGEMEITPADIAEFAQNFSRGVRRDIPITEGHDNGMSGGELPAVGWFTELHDRGDAGLYAGVKWTDEGKQLLTTGSFKYFSPEFYEQYADPETGVKYGHVLVGGALTNKPYFKELDPVATFSEPDIMKLFTDDMDLNTILAKKPDELSDEEKSYVRDHKSELNDDQTTAFASVLADGGDEGAGDGAGDGSGSGDGNGDGTGDGNGSGDGERKAHEPKGRQIVMSEAEVAVLRAKADEGAKAFAEVEKMKLDKEVDRLVFSETNAEGRILSKQKDAVVKLMFSLSDTQRDQFRNIINNLPKPALSFGEIGSGSGGTADKGAASEVEGKVKEMMKTNSALKYSEALSQVFSENPELAAQYNDEMQANRG